MKTLNNFNFKNKKVLVRCDFNVPLNQKGNILDDFRIKKTIPTIEYLIKKRAKLLLMTHLGRPKGKAVKELRLTPVQKRLRDYLDIPVDKTESCIGKEVENSVKSMQPGEILLLENLKFHKGEEENDENFARELAKLGDIYINDAFASCHHFYTSIVGLPKYLPSGIGLLMEKEIKILRSLTEKPEKPLIVVIGGAKVKTKAKLIDKISIKADFVLIGELIKKEIKEKNIFLKYPQKIIEPIDNIKEKDIGPKTVNIFKEKISLAKTVFWAGPLGKIEQKQFQRGSRDIAQAIIKNKLFSIAGGGDTVGFINNIGLIEKFSHISTGGGAMLSFLSGEKLPGIEVLK